MTDMQSRRATGPYLASAPTDEPTPSGWVLFAGIMLAMVGAFQVVAGLVALLSDNFYIVTKNKLVVHVDYTTWGWFHLAVGVIAVLAGIGVMGMVKAARIVGIVLASIGAIGNLAFMPAYPLWCLTLIALDVLVIFALAVHGRDVMST